MPVALILLVLGVLLLGAFGAWQRSRRVSLEHEHHIRSFVFPSAVLQKLQETYPHIELKGAHLAARALRQFFLVHLRAQGRLIAMPSKAADALWHAFILDTKAYAAFCKAAFGAYLHHIPEQAMTARDKDGSASWRTWRLACLEENINPHNATRLPLLYALDVKLGIEGAISYDPASFKRPTKSDGCGGGGGGSCGGDGDGGGCGGGCGGSD
jgi:hypothetical protein